MKGFAMLNPLEIDELPIRETLCTLFQKKIPNMNPYDFYYIKRGINKLVYPETASNYVWNYSNIKLLCGQGKLYCCQYSKIGSIHMSTRLSITSQFFDYGPKIQPNNCLFQNLLAVPFVPTLTHFLHSCLSEFLKEWSTE